MSRASQRHIRQRAPGLSVSYDALILAANPVAYLTLGGGSAGIADRTGNAHTGTPHNDPGTTTFSDGSLATLFNGISQYIEIPDHAVLSAATTGILAIEAWIRPDTLEFPNDEDTGYVHFLGKGEPSKHEYAGRIYSFTNTEVPPRPNRISGYAFNAAGGLGAGSYFEDTVTPGQWIHVAIVINTINTSASYPTGYTKIYKNGIQRDIDSLTDYNIIPTHGDAPLRIGTRDLLSYFLGAIAKVAVYTYEPSGATIRAHYEAIVPAAVGSALFVKHIGAATAKAAGTTLTFTVPSGGVPIGNTLIVRVLHDYTSGGPTMSDVRGNTYVRDRTGPNTGTTLRMSIFSCRVTTALQAGDTITLTTSASITSRAAAIDEFSHILLPIAIDAQDAANGSSATPTLTLTTTTADTLLVGMVGTESSSATPYNEDSSSPWNSLMAAGTAGGASDTNVTINGAYRALATTGVYTYSPTLGNSANWIEFLVAYRAQA